MRVPAAVQQLSAARRAVAARYRAPVQWFQAVRRDLRQVELLPVRRVVEARHQPAESLQAV
jgi:hypothetical protein